MGNTMSYQSLCDNINELRELCPWKDIFKKKGVKLVGSWVQEGIFGAETSQKGETEGASETHLFYNFELCSASWID